MHSLTLKLASTAVCVRKPFNCISLFAFAVEKHQNAAADQEGSDLRAAAGRHRRAAHLPHAGDQQRKEKPSKETVRINTVSKGQDLGHLRCKSSS